MVRLTPVRHASIRGIRKVLQLLSLTRWFPQGKSLTELSFQATWARQFRRERAKALEYWRRYRYFDEILMLIQPGQKRILDVGCGISTVLHFLDGERVGIDPLAEWYKQLYAYPDGIQIRRAAGERIPFPDASFDVVFCSNALDHTTDPAATVAEIYRVLKPSGYFVLTVEIFTHPGPRDAGHPHSFRRDDVVRLLGERFEICFRKESEWIGLQNYTLGRTRHHRTNELVVVAAKDRAAASPVRTARFASRSYDRVS